MHAAKGLVLELILENGLRYAQIACPATLIPAPGQYLLASHASDSPLPVPVFYTDSAPQGFIAAAPETWTPGLELFLRGPLGHGFTLPAAARKVALVAFGDSPARLRGLIAPSLKQGAAVVIVTDADSDALPTEVEVQPLSALGEVMAWADALFFDVAREDLARLREKVRPVLGRSEAQVLIRAPMPCGGVAECGVCAVTLKSGWELACKEGPVFRLDEI